MDGRKSQENPIGSALTEGRGERMAEIDLKDAHIKTYVDGKKDFGGAEIIVNDEALFEKILKLLEEHRKGEDE